MNRRRAVVTLGSLGGAAACAAAAVALAGCPNTAATSIYTPPTGIQIDSQTLVAGIGCGQGPGQVYRYAAVVGPPAPDGGFGTDGTPITSGVFDCFADGLFTNLPSPDGGSTDFGIDIYAFDRAAFPAELGGCENLPLNVACPGDQASVVLRYSAKATWQTHCRVTQSQGVPQVADCPYLLASPPAPGEGGMGGDAGDATTSSDAPADTSAEAADAPAESADAPTAEASDGAGVSGEGGDAPLE